MRSFIAIAVCWLVACSDPDPEQPPGGGGEPGVAGAGGGGGGEAASSGSGGTSQAGSSAGLGGSDDGPEDLEGSSRLALGTEFGCAINRHHDIECWGMPTSDDGQTAAPAGSYVQIRGSGATACAVTAGSSFDCWGALAGEPSGAPPSGTDTADVAVGGHACMLRRDGSIRCTGSVENGGIGLQLGPFIGVGAGNGTSCGLKETGDVLCWGNDDHGIVTDAPTGALAQIAVGENHACAIRPTDSSVVCWGAGDSDDPNGNDPELIAFGQAVPPAGEFVAVAAGLGHSCGIHENGTVECWGAGTTVENCEETLECGQAIAPTGTFVQVACGTSNSCGIKDDGSLECWGSNTGDRSTPPAEFRAF
ncbi:MAG TPA: hypothetical protein VIW29_03415 [Polyangiaceae bacterium]